MARPNVRRRAPCFACGHILPSVPPGTILLRWGNTPDGEPEEWEYSRKRCKTSAMKGPGHVIVRDVQQASLTADGELIFDETRLQTVPSIDILGQALKDLRANRDRTEPLIYRQATLKETNEMDEMRRETKRKAIAAKAKAAATAKARRPDAERQEGDDDEDEDDTAEDTADDVPLPPPGCTCPVPDGFRRILIVSPSFSSLSVGIVNDAKRLLAGDTRAAS